ncbi:hypothetical protein T492DRAFT_1101889 [Pavlovales sp. CCMP2436]|nr:hypothetical protein T492DRAFT_1101889 [Pavlovales sp. CCMP2436]
MLDEEHLHLTPIADQLGGLYTSDSEVDSLPPFKLHQPFDPHTPLNPRAGPAGDLPTPLEPRNARVPLMGGFSPAAIPSRRALDSSTLTSAGVTASESGSDSSHLQLYSKPGEAAFTTTPRTAAARTATDRPLRSTAADRPTRIADRSTRSTRSASRRREIRVEEEEEEEDLESVFRSLHALARELRTAFVEGPSPRPFGASSYGTSPGAHAGTSNYAHRKHSPREMSFISSGTHGLGAAAGRAADRSRYSLATRMQLAAAHARATGGGTLDLPVHCSSFQHAGRQFVITVSLR